MDKETQQKVGKRVQRLREDLSLTQKELARLVGLSKGTISGIEIGAQGISRSAAKLADALGTTTDYLYGLTDNPLPPNDEEEDDERPPVNAARDAMCAEYDRLDEIDQQVLYQMAVTLRLARERRKTTQRVIE